MAASASFRISQSQGNRVLKSGGPFTRLPAFAGSGENGGSGENAAMGASAKLIRLRYDCPGRQPGCFNCVPPIIPAAHPSFPRSLSPTLIGEREPIPPLTRHSREACPRPRSGSGNPSRRSPVIPVKLVPGPDRGAGTHPATHPSFPRSLSPAPIGEREAIPPLTRHSHENSRFHIHTRPRGPCAIPAPRARSGSGKPSRRSPVFPAQLVPGPDRGAGTHPAAHPSFPRSLSPALIGEREPIPPLTRHSRGSGNPSRHSPVIPAGAGSHPAAHPSFPREREAIPPLTRHSRENGNPCGLDVGLPLANPKGHGKTGVVAKTKGPLPSVLNPRHLALDPSGDHSLRC